MYPIKELREITGLTPLMEEERKLKWFGHIRRSTLPIKSNLGRKMKEREATRRSKDDIKEGTNLECNEPNTKVKDRVNRQLEKTVMRDVIRKMNEHVW